MKCAICLNTGSNVTEMYNDCVIESLEKIKVHYMVFKKQLCDNELAISALKERNRKLETTVEYYQQMGKHLGKTSHTNSEGHGTESQCSDILENPIIDKSIDDFNTALNNENEFEISFINNSPIRMKGEQLNVKREPMKLINEDRDHVNDTFASFSNKSTPNNKLEGTVLNDNRKGNKKASWISKENKIKSSNVGSFNRDLRHLKQERKSLSLQSGRLRQTRLQMDISKNIPNTRDLTFCDEVIEASPMSNSTLRKTVSSKQWSLGNISNIIKSESGNISEYINPRSEKLSSPKTENKELETSSVVILSPTTQNTICLDDSESFNIESMDLLRDVMNLSENHLNNLRQIESKRIKLLQKTVNETAENGIDHNQDSANDSIKLNNSNKDDLNMKHFKEVIDDKMITQESHILKQNKVKDENQESVKKKRIFNVDCSECQKYIKYLGAHLTDEEIKQHIRNCTKHKKRIEINLTPEGFWDPLIKPFDKNDPRNKTLIDTRFTGKERRN